MAHFGFWMTFFKECSNLGHCRYRSGWEELVGRAEVSGKGGCNSYRKKQSNTSDRVKSDLDVVATHNGPVFHYKA